MTVLSSTRRSPKYLGDGANRSWDFAFTANEAAHIRLLVQRNGGPEEVIASGFSVTPLPANGGTVQWPLSPAAPLSAADTVIVYREVPLTQPARYSNDFAFNAERHERSYDLLAMQIQQVAERVGESGGSGGGGGGVSWFDISSRPTTLQGFGLLAEVQGLVGSGGGGGTGSVSWDRITGEPTSLSGYGITDAYTKAQVDQKIEDIQSGDGPKPSLRIKSVWDFGADGLGGAADQKAYNDARVAAGNDRPVISDSGDFKIRAISFNPYGDDYLTDSGTGLSLYQGSYLSSDATTVTPSPIMRLDKVSGMNQSAGRVWDVGALEINYEKRSGNAYASGLSVLATHTGGENDVIAGHFRTTINTKGTGGRGWALWGYVTNRNDTLTPWHAAEFNGCNQGIDPGYNGQAQLIRLCMSDISDPGNRMSSAIAIGKSTHGGNNGFYTGIRVEADAIIPTADYQADGDAIRIDGPASGGNIGGLRFTNRMKFGMKTLEATLSNGAALWMAAGQRLVWGDAAGECAITSSPSANSLEVTTDLKTRNIVVATTKKLFFTDGNGPNIFQESGQRILNVDAQALGVTNLSIGGNYISAPNNTQLNFVSTISSTKAITSGGVITGAVLASNAGISAQGNITTPANVSGGSVTAGSLQVDSTANISSSLRIAGTKVLGPQQVGTVKLGPSADTTTMKNVINHITTILENHGIMAPSTGNTG